MMRAVLAPLVGAAVGLVLGALIIAASGADPLAAYAALARGALGGARPLTETALKATPLVIMGLGLVVAFRCRIWNIGGEGQYFAGALAGTVVGLLGQASLPASLLIPLMLLAGIAGGAVWAALAAWLRLGFGVNEIIATIMLNFVALYAVSYLARGPLRDPMGYLPQSARLEEVGAPSDPAGQPDPSRRPDRAAARSRDLRPLVEDHGGLPAARHRLERPRGARHRNRRQGRRSRSRS